MSDSELPLAALPAWEAYKAMERTKRRHLNFLKELSERHRGGGVRTMAEGVYLERLLKEHDGQVSMFRSSMTELMQADLTAHASLIEYIKKFNETLGTEDRPH